MWVFDVDWWMGLLPLFLEILVLFSVGLATIVTLEVFFDFGNSFELLNDLLVMAATLCSGPILEIFLKGFKYFGSST